MNLLLFPSGRNKSRINPDFSYPNRLRVYRIAGGYTLRDLAEFLGCTPQAVRNAEIYGNGLNKQRWYRLADLFDCDPRLLETPPEKI